MKNLFLMSVFLLSAFNAANANKSEAGLIIGAIAGDAGKGAGLGALIGGGGVIIAGTISMISSPDLSTPPITLAFSVLGAMAGAVLNVDASLNKDMLIAAFKQQFPFINSPEALGNLAEITKSKLHSQVLANASLQSAMINFSESETLTALEGSSISAEQLTLVINALK